MQNVVQIESHPHYRSGSTNRPVATGDHEDSGPETKEEPARWIWESNNGEQALKKTATIEDFYSDLGEIRPEVATILRLLRRAIEHIDSALAAYQDEEIIQGDVQMQQVQALLRELFCFRSIGDGFASIINAVMFAFENRAGLPLEEPQVRMVRVILKLAMEQPFLTHDAAVDQVMRLEDAGLIVDAPELSDLADLQ